MLRRKGRPATNQNFDTNALPNPKLEKYVIALVPNITANNLLPYLQLKRHSLLYYTSICFALAEHLEFVWELRLKIIMELIEWRQCDRLCRTLSKLWLQAKQNPFAKYYIGTNLFEELLLVSANMNHRFDFKTVLCSTKLLRSVVAFLFFFFVLWVDLSL
jgi:hypothetical protein